MVVFAVVSNDGKVVPPHFVETGLQINIGECLTILIDVFLAWIPENYNPNKLMMVQDSAPAHGAKKNRLT